MQKNLATWKQPSIFILEEKKKLFFVGRKGEDLSLYSIPLSRICIQSLDLVLCNTSYSSQFIQFYDYYNLAITRYKPQME